MSHSPVSPRGFPGTDKDKKSSDGGSVMDSVFAAALVAALGAVLYAAADQAVVSPGGLPRQGWHVACRTPLLGGRALASWPSAGLRWRTRGAARPLQQRIRALGSAARLPPVHRPSP